MYVGNLWKMLKSCFKLEQPASSIRARSHTFVEIDHEIIAAVILHLQLIQEGLLSVKAGICTKNTDYLTV